MNTPQNADIVYTQSENLLQDAQQIIETAQSFAYRAVNVAMVQRNWLLGRRIAEEELQGEDRAKYGAEIIKQLSYDLTQIYGKGFTKSNLYSFLEFHKAFPNIFHALPGKSETPIFQTVSGKLGNEIFHTPSGKSEIAILGAVRPKSFSLLTWSHYSALLQVKALDAREWYAREAAQETWSVRTLQRNISSQYYYLSESGFAGLKD